MLSTKEKFTVDGYEGKRILFANDEDWGRIQILHASKDGWEIWVERKLLSEGIKPLERVCGATH